MTVHISSVTVFNYNVGSHNLAIQYNIDNDTRDVRINPYGIQECAGRAAYLVYSWIFGLHVNADDRVPEPQNLQFGFRRCVAGAELGDVEIFVGYEFDDDITWIQLAEVWQALVSASTPPTSYDWYAGPPYWGNSISVLRDGEEISTIEMKGNLQGLGQDRSESVAVLA